MSFPLFQQRSSEAYASVVSHGQSGVLLRGAADRSASSLPSSPRNHCAAGCSTSSGVALAGRRPMCALKWFGLAMQEQQRTAGARELSLE